MSYVIQNFYSRSRYVVQTPRFKFLFLLVNLEKIFIFLKLTTFLYAFNRFANYSLDHFFFFLKVFFSKQYIKLMYKLNLLLVANYTNNLIKSTIFHIFNKFSLYLSTKNLFVCSLIDSDQYLFNLYWCSIKILPLRITHFFYKNIFFFYMFIFSFLWHQHYSFIKFYLNFLFVDFNFQTSRFYNTYFLKIYNF